MPKIAFDPSSKTGEQIATLREAAFRNQEEYQRAFKAGYADALEKRPSRKFPNRDIDRAYLLGYAKGGKGLAIKL